ncbi:ATP-binding protein [Pseudoneobacillus sp. C159]
MNIKGYVKKSLSTKYATLVGISIVFFLIGTAVLWLFLHSFKVTYSTQIELLEEKQNLAQEINDSFNSAISDARGYYAYGNPALKENALQQAKVIIQLEDRFAHKATTAEDQQFLKSAQQFTSFYFGETLPVAIADFENGHLDNVAQQANREITAKIKNFQKDSKEYITRLNKDLEDSFNRLIQLQSYVQIAFTVFILLILVTILRITRIMFRNVGQPLSQLAMAANDLANGKEVPMEQLISGREDEIGALSIAFRKMLEKVHEKEENLISRNEELFHQKEELRFKQTELEAILSDLKNSQLNLQKRNDLINKISNSLDKKEVMDSIVVNMCSIIEADCGMLVLLNEDNFSSYGITNEAAHQFKNHLHQGLGSRLKVNKQPFVVKRELANNEKGYHQHIGYSYDLYLPVLASDNDLMVILLLSRFAGNYTSEQIDDYMALTKNIALSLEKIRIYEQSEEARRLNQDILNTIQEGIQLVDSSGKIVKVNTQLSDMFHWNGRELVGCHFHDWSMVLAKQVQESEGLIDFLQHSIQSVDFNISQNTYIYKKVKPYQVIKVYCERLSYGDEQLGTVIVHRDITKEYEVDQMKSEFVSTVSHELRTPLASILGFTELILNRKLQQDKQQKYLSTIYNEAKRLTALINDFLDVQRMESGKQTYEKKFIQLQPIIEKVIDNQKINTNQHVFQIIDETNGELILGDRDKMEQVFMNLISNAVKYSPSGGEINIRLFTNEEKICVSIEDQGLGIPEESMKLLFTKFFRIDNTDRRRIGGTGLGLAIVQEIIKAHNGEITVQSTYEKGSTFTCSFPLVPAQKESNPSVVMKENGYQVLVVEDDLSLGQLISQELRENHFQVSYFKRGQDALDSLRHEIPDAIVLDILLEEDEIDGWGIMEIIKKDDTLKDIPIFVSSALDEKEKGFALGAIEYLIKPYKPSQLSKTIMQTLLKNGKLGQVYIPEDGK